MARTSRAAAPNAALMSVLARTDRSHERLARHLNALAADHGLHRRYTHTSLQNWARRGMTPEPPIPALLAEVLSDALGRRVTVSEIGMTESETGRWSMGLDFPRELGPAVRNAVDLWSDVDRRDFLTNAGVGGFAVAAYGTPLTRWLITPADDRTGHRGTTRAVGAADVASLQASADQARRWDSQYGGGDWRTAAVSQCLSQQAGPLLRGTYTEATGRALFAASAELSRVAGFAYFDAGHHRLAQAHLIQALRLARASGDVSLGGYVLATMALQTLLRGYPTQAIDMAEAATNRAAAQASPRAAAFYKIAEARAHAAAGNAAAAERALFTAEHHLSRATPDDHDPAGLEYVTPERLAADAVVVYQHLHRLDHVHRWDSQARRRGDRFARSNTLNELTVAIAAAQAHELDEALHRGGQSLDLLTTVSSQRTTDRVHILLDELHPWRREPRIHQFVQRALATVAA